jgi:DNA-binding LacI/PurR family transcriptional regulator
MKSRPSLTAIGRELNVSVAAVSNALSGKGRMSQELRDKIINYSTKLAYRPNVNANRLRDGKSNQILFGALVEPDSLFDVNHAFLIHYLVNYLMKHGYDLVVHPLYRTAESRQHFLDKILSRAADGVILQMDATLEPELVSQLSRMKTPAVIFDSSSDAVSTTEVSLVTSSFVNAFKEAFTALSFADDTPVYYFDNNWSKYDSTYRDFLLACGKRTNQLYDASSYTATLKSVEKLVAEPVRPFGLMVRQDYSFSWCLRALDRFQLKPGRDLHLMLCNFGKQDLFYEGVPMALIMDSYDDIAQKITEMLIKQLSDSGNAPVSYIYPAKLLIFKENS